MTDRPAPIAAFDSLDAIRAALAAAPGPDAAARAAAGARNDSLTKPQGALGRLEEIALWHCAWRGVARPAQPKAQILIFAGSHGVARRGVSAYPPEVTAQMVANFESGGAAINQLAALHDATLRVVPLAIETPTEDFTEAPAMSEAELLDAFNAGAAALDPAADCLILGEMGIANTTAAAALCAGLFGGAAEDWTGPGTGVSGLAFEAKRETVRLGVARHKTEIAAAEENGPLEALRRLGGRELAAICGAALAARLARVPLLLDGFVVSAAVAPLSLIREDALDHCLAGHVSAEPGHARLLAALGKEPLLKLGMRLGEGSGAAAGFGLLRAAIACHSGMASFAEAAVSGRVGED